MYNIRLDDPLTISRIESLARTERAELKSDSVVGRFATSPLIITSASRLCEEFANSPETPAAILQFTRKYAPLTYEGGRAVEANFKLDLEAWRFQQRMLRERWVGTSNSLRQARSARLKIDGAYSWTFPSGSVLHPSLLGIVIQIPGFLNVVELCFALIPLERIRACPVPGCTKPYFVADHLKQTYCGCASCVEWGARARKLEYWNRNKEHYLAKRKQKRKE